MESFQVLSNPRNIYEKMLEDIKFAKKSIYLETYIYDDDRVGREFRKLLTKKASQGVRVFLLMDGWGSSVTKKYFKELIQKGGNVRFFREIRYVLRFFSKNHERNHRKLLIVDKKISYVGSINITAHSINWRELVLRLEGGISNLFYESFMKSWNIFNKFKYRQIKSFVHEKFKIINDAPIHKRKKTYNNYIKLIDGAKKEIRIETPYFIPSNRVMKAFARAIKRGVRIMIVLPKISDVRITDMLRTAYFGKLYKCGVKIYFYKSRVLHSKLLIVDDKFFLLGSSNLDYRSFIHQYEINLLGEDKEIIKKLKRHFNITLSRTENFNYNEWKNRGILKKMHERMFYFIKEYL